MLKVLPIFKPEPYVTRGERGAEKPTRFLLRGLTGIERVDAKLRYDKDNRLPYFDRDSCLALLSRGLVGWENFAGDDGQLVSFSQADQDANLSRLSLELVVELAVEVWNRSHLSEGQEKNSSSQRTSQQSEEGPSTAGAADGAGTATNPDEPR